MDHATNNYVPSCQTGFSAQMFGINDGSGASTVARRHLSGVMNATANVTDAPHFVADISLSSAWVVYTMSMVIAIVSYVTLYMCRAGPPQTLMSQKTTDGETALLDLARLTGSSVLCTR